MAHSSLRYPLKFPTLIVRVGPEATKAITAAIVRRRSFIACSIVNLRPFGVLTLAEGVRAAVKGELKERGPYFSASCVVAFRPTSTRARARRNPSPAQLQ